MDTQKAVEYFNEIRDIPYSTPLSLQEANCCCTGKNLLLLNKLRGIGYDARWRVCSFKWSELDSPEEVTTAPHEDESTHAYLEFFVDGAWRVVDATWDSPLKGYLPVTGWDGISATPIGVNPIEIFSPEKSDEIMSMPPEHGFAEDIEKNGKFYQALNNWLLSLRKD